MFLMYFSRCTVSYITQFTSFYYLIFYLSISGIVTKTKRSNALVQIAEGRLGYTHRVKPILVDIWHVHRGVRCSIQYYPRKHSTAERRRVPVRQFAAGKNLTQHARFFRPTNGRHAPGPSGMRIYAMQCVIELRLCFANFPFAAHTQCSHFTKAFRSLCRRWKRALVHC